MEKLKVLNIVPSLSLCNGVASYSMNYYHNIDHSRVEVEYAILNDESPNYYSDLKTKYYQFNVKQVSVFKLILRIKKFFKENNDYDIVHCHVSNYGLFFMYYAKKYGIKTRILHSHATQSSDNKLKNIVGKIIRTFTIHFSNVFCACSEQAGSFMFKKRKFYIIPNAIDTERFSYNSSMRKKIRRENGWDKNKVITNVGRFTPVKNQLFLIEMMKELITLYKVENYKLLLIGDGVLKEKIMHNIEKYNLNKYVEVVSNTKNIENYYQASDIFVLPSLFEGFGMVLIEAQCTGLSCVASNTVPKNTNAANMVSYISLDRSAKYWAMKIKEKLEKKLVRVSKNNEISQSGYSIKDGAEKLVKYYDELVKKSC